MTSSPVRVALGVLACLPCVVSADPIGQLEISWGHGPVVPIHGPEGIAMAMEVVPLEAKGGGSWLPTPSSAPAGFDKNDFYSFCTDAGVQVQSHAYYAARPFASLGAIPNPGVWPAWRTDASGSWLSAIEDAQFLYVHNYSTAFPVIGGKLTVDPIAAAGLQLAIWNVLYDNDRSIYYHDGDVFYADSAWNDPNDSVRASAQTFLNGVPADGSPTLQQYQAAWLDPRLAENGYPNNPRPTQGLIYFRVPDTAGTCFLLTIALGGLGVFSRKISSRGVPATT